MDREIKFRGKEFKSGEWIYGDLHVLCDSPHIHTAMSHYPYAGHRGFVDDKTIGQFTGLRDKSGREIYEGDIVCKRDLTFGLKFDGVVVYNSETGCFRIHSENNGVTMRMGFEASDVYNDGKCTVPVKYEYEVVGNIYDNPELLDNVSRK